MHHAVAAASFSFCAARRGAVRMVDPALVALSLLPIHLLRTAGDRLRAGDAPSSVLDGIVGDRWPEHSGARAALLANAAAAITRATDRKLGSIPWTAVEYPPALAAIVDPPPVLWTRGLAETLRLPAIAIVGSRAASPYAMDVAARLASDLAARGIAIVSGLARGVDSAAHRGALAVDGPTIAVLGCGADVIYPAEHRLLARSIEGRGLILSELVAGTPPLPHFFPQRNRIISGLSRAVVVVEAGERSGSLITARCALEQGRDVLAVPGNVLSERNRGAHALLRDGARLVETADDVLDELNGGGGATIGHSVGDAAARHGIPMAARHDPLLASLPAGETCDLEQIAERSGLSAARLLPRLFELELQGMVARVGGGRFVRVDRSC